MLCELNVGMCCASSKMIYKIPTTVSSDMIFLELKKEGKKEKISEDRRLLCLEVAGERGGRWRRRGEAAVLQFLAT